MKLLLINSIKSPNRGVMGKEIQHWIVDMHKRQVARASGRPTQGPHMHDKRYRERKATCVYHLGIKKWKVRS